MRPQPLVRLLESVAEQLLYPNEILIVDGSTNAETENILLWNSFINLKYFKVFAQDRGLTRQRNFGITQIGDNIDIVCFLDDDTVLTESYFKELIGTYSVHPEALGVGGYIINEVQWRKNTDDLSGRVQSKPNEFSYDGWKRKDGSRFVLRKKLGLDANKPPAHFPDFGHGRSVSFLPPSGKIYEVEQFMGGVASYRKEILNNFKFSEYFEGYGLYEDADFTLRLSKVGKLYVNTAAQLYHHHEVSGRPNSYKYGKMVVRNGWYVWRIKHPKPSLQARFKWNIIFWLLTVIRFSNVITESNKKEALNEAMGRTMGWIGLLIKKPKIK
tara:strand:+ start:1760 stop:2740 length:981 start_codon:yes stop_codon:yes gene_type:complete